MPKGDYEVEIPVFARITVGVKMPNKKKAYREAWERIRAVFNTLPPDMSCGELVEDEYAVSYVDGAEYDG
jgi:hypothetical protein